MIEVAITSLQDLRDKAKIYAEGGVPEYWIVDAQGRRLELRTGPMPHGYHAHRVLSETDTVTLPGTQMVWTVASLLP